MTSRSISLTLALFVGSVPLLAWAIELGVAFTASHVLGLIIMAMAAATWWRRRLPIPRDVSVLSVVAFFVLATVTVTLVLLRPDIHMSGESAHAKSIKQLIGLGYGTGLFLALYCLLRWYTLGRFALQIHYWVTAAFAVLTLVQYGIAWADMTSPLANFSVHNSTIGATRSLSLAYGFPRVTLTLVEPSMLSIYLLSGWALWLYSSDRPSLLVADRARTLFTGSGVVLGVSIVITGSRLGYVVFGALVLGALAVRPRRLRRVAIVGISVLIGIALTGPAHTQGLVATLLPKTPPPSVADRIPVVVGQAAADVTESGPVPAPSRESSAVGNVQAVAETMEDAVGSHDVSVQHRTASYLVAVRVLREHPMLGTGFGTSGFYMERYWPDSFVPLPVERVAAPTMLSQYATIATETGLLGVLCLMTLSIAVIWQLWRTGRSGPAELSLAWGIGASLASYCISGLATPLVVYQILLMWLLLALALTVGGVRQLDAVAPPPPRRSDA